MVGNRYKAILFDLDGTLLDTTTFTYQAYAYAFRQLGLRPVPEKRIAASMGLPSIEESYQLLSGLESEVTTKLVEQHRTFQRSHLQLVKPFSSTIPTLQKLVQRKIPLAIITSRIYNVYKLLSDNRLIQYFDVVIIGGEVSKYKPDPEAVDLALSRLKVQAKDALVVGDTSADILAGKNSGVATFAVTSGFYTRQQLDHCQPDFIEDSIERLVELTL